MYMGMHLRLPQRFGKLLSRYTTGSFVRTAQLHKVISHSSLSVRLQRFQDGFTDGSVQLVAYVFRVVLLHNSHGSLPEFSVPKRRCICAGLHGVTCQKRAHAVLATVEAAESNLAGRN